MRLDDARLCLDCEEIHNEHECPACGSEAFAFLKRWIKTTSSRPRPASTRDSRAAVDVVSRPVATSEQLDAWRQIVEGKTPEPRRGRLIARGLVGLAAMGLAGWAWTRAGRKDDAPEGS
jgi:hypothetical protein